MMKFPLIQRLRGVWSGVKKSWNFPWNPAAGIDGLSSGEKLSRPMEQSAWVMRAIKKISGPISAVPIQFASDQRGGRQLIADPELMDFWSAPALGLSYQDFIEATVGWIKLEGEAFWVLDDTYLQPFPEVAQRAKLIVVRPERMRCVIEDGKLVGWALRDEKGVTHSLLPDQVIHIKCWNPYDPWRGLAEYKAAQLAAEADYLSAKFQKNLMANNGDQGVYIIAKGGIPTDEQRSQIVNQLREKRQMQQQGYFKPLFLTGDISIEDPKIRTPDGNFMAQRLENRHEIFIAFGVPPSMADVVASYSIGSASDRFLLLEETCIPLSEKIAAQIEAVELRRTGRRLYAQFRWDDHSVMQQVRRERIDSAIKLWTVGMPMKQVNDYLQLRMPEFEGWELGYLPFSVSPVGIPEPSTNEDYSEDVDTAEDTDEEEENASAMMRRAFAERATGERDPKEIALWRERMAKRREVQKSYESRFNRELMKARREVLSKLEASQKAGHRTRAAAADFMFDLEKFSDGLLASMRKAGTDALNKAGQQMLAELKIDDPFKMPPAKAIEFLRQRENKLSNTPKETFDDVSSAIQSGLNEGESIAQISDRVRTSFNGISNERAKRIAMTETAAACGFADQEAMKQAGIEYKQWLTSGNPNVRPAHAAANGQVVKVDEAFSVGGELLMHPGDPNGSPENVINCHCVVIAVADKPATE